MLGHRSVLAIPLLALLIGVKAPSQAPDLQQHLQSEYVNKIFLLREFYSNNDVKYDSDGATLGKVHPGAWTADGFLLVTEIRVGGSSLAIKARRLVVVSTGHGFQFTIENPKKRLKAWPVKLEVAITPDRSVEQLDAAMAKIFLSDNDSLLGLLPTYWQTCVSAGLYEVNDPNFSGCRFSTELLSIPGVNGRADLRPKAEAVKVEVPKSNYLTVHKVTKDISPPKQVFAPEPEFSAAARQLKLRGAATLGLIVDEQGNPQNIEILSPLGAGLDEQAVSAVGAWKFKPAQRQGDGPVAVKIAVEVDFHLF